MSRARSMHARDSRFRPRALNAIALFVHASQHSGCTWIAGSWRAIASPYFRAAASVSPSFEYASARTSGSMSILPGEKPERPQASIIPRPGKRRLPNAAGSGRYRPGYDVRIAGTAVEIPGDPSMYTVYFLIMVY